MNAIVATRVIIVGARAAYALKTHRKQMKKIRAQREFWDEYHAQLKRNNENPQPIYVVCERLA